MKMKIVLTVMLFVSMNALYAQDKSNEERAKMLTENMKKNLALADDQYEKVYTIDLFCVSKASQIRNSGCGQLDKARKLKSADGDRDKMLKGVLTEEQYKKFKAQKAEDRKKMKKRYAQRKENG